MQLQAVDTVDTISAADFKNKYYNTMRPVVIKNLSKEWPAYKKWSWDYFIDMVGDKEVGVYKRFLILTPCIKPHRFFATMLWQTPRND